MIQAPSIFTQPHIEHRGGQRVITSFDRILGIDLAPLGRNGIATAAIVYAGETTPPPELRVVERTI